MRAQYRCALSPDACPASGFVVLLDDGEDERTATCSLCGRPLRFTKTRDDEVTGRPMARVPTHRRLDAQFKAQQADAATKAYALAAVHERLARSAARRTPRRALPLVRRAMASVSRLPNNASTTKRWKALARIAARLAALDPSIRVKSSTRWQLSRLEDASNLDTGAIDSDYDPRTKSSSWADHLRAALPAAAVKAVLRQRPERQVTAGLLALLKRLKARTWADFEEPTFVGQQSFLDFVREWGADQPFAGLRLPDSFYAWKAQQTDDAVNMGDEAAAELLPF